MAGKRFVTTTLLIVAAVGRLTAQQPSPLAGAYSAKVGDVVAQTLSEWLKLKVGPEAAVVTYEPTTQTVDVEIFASPPAASKTDQARATLGQYWDYIEKGHIPYVERRFGVKLSAQNYRLMYYDRKAQPGPQLVLQFVNGQYTIP